jgi:hypothetical protein
MDLALNLQRDGRFSMAQRLLDAQRESLLAAQYALVDIGRAMARRNHGACYDAMILAAAHYRNAGDANMAAHWDIRAKRFAVGG